MIDIATQQLECLLGAVENYIQWEDTPDKHISREAMLEEVKRAEKLLATHKIWRDYQNLKLADQEVVRTILEWALDKAKHAEYDVMPTISPNEAKDAFKRGEKLEWKYKDSDAWNPLHPQSTPSLFDNGSFDFRFAP